MLGAVLVVSRETLEAAFYISLTLIYSESLKINIRWLSIALALAFINAFFLAANMQSISDWYDGIGQELIHALSLSATALSLMLLNYLVYLKVQWHLPKEKFNRWISLIMGFCLLNAVSLEASEIIIYYLSAIQQEGSALGTTVGCFLGAGIGLSIGIISYYSIRSFPKYRLYIALSLLTLVSTGMLSQSISFLAQAGLIESGLTLWDSSNIIDETSIVGQLLYALIGYESTPTLAEVITYWSSLGLSILVFTIIFFRGKNRSLSNEEV